MHTHGYRGVPGGTRRLATAAFALLALLLCSATALADPLGEAARRSGRPLVVDFGQNLCKQCVLQAEAMEKFKSSVGAKIDTRFVHVIKESELTSQYKVLMIPTILFLDDRGKEVFRRVGYMNFDAMMAKAGELGLLGR